MYFSSLSVIDRLIWIVSLSDDEKGSTRRVQEDLEPCFQRIGLPFEYVEPQSKAELIDILRRLVVQAKAGARPIIHIDAHGTKRDGLRIAASGQFISWQELNKEFQAINFETQNNLCVVSAVCYGLNVIYSLKITEPCPFLLIVAPETEISFGVLEDALVNFYRDTFIEKDFTQAFDNHLKTHMTLINSEKLLALCLARYVRNYCTGRGGEKRRENLLTEAVWTGNPP